jgi:hypothetical protein
MQISSSIDAAAPTPSSGAGPAYRRRTIATNFFAMTAVSGIVLLIGIFATAYSRRVLGPAAIGQVNWNAALLAFLTLLASPGLALVGSWPMPSWHCSHCSLRAADRPAPCC